MELELSEKQQEWCREALDALRSEREGPAKAEYALLTFKEAAKLQRCAYPFCRTTSRVVLSEDPSALVDANLISKSSAGPVSICAGQPDSPVVFWTMVVEQNCKAIVKLTQDQEREYFPTKAGARSTYGEISVTNLSTQCSQYGVVKRLLKVEWQAKNKSITVDHFQLSWPDFCVPERMEPLQEIFAALYKIDSGAYIVHCRAGIGRSGTFVTFDHILRRVLSGDISAVDVSRTLEELRERRRALVETPEQYWFCFRALIRELEFLLACNRRKETTCHYATSLEV